MFRPMRTTTRRGNILLVTILLLALFAIVGITMVYYATAQAERARILTEAANNSAGDFTDDGKAALNQYLAQLIYGTPDSGTGLASSLRGHSLMATMYGRYTIPASGAPFQGGTTVAWNGVGTFNEPPYSTGVSRQVLMNYRQFGTTVTYHPEWTGEYTFGAAPGSVPTSAYVPKNAPYTYPDLNNSFLGVINPATGEVLVPSYYRQQAFGLLDPSNPHWADTVGKYLLLRPRPADHINPATGKSEFPAVPPDADGVYRGDVQNLPGGVGIAHNDSIWIDINAPIVTGPDGKKYKMLVAPLILDLNGRLNLSVHGNRMKPLRPINSPEQSDDFGHTSGVGIAPYEVSLERAFGANSQEARYLVFQRGRARSGSNQVIKSFASNPASYPSGQQLPLYASVPWTGNGGSYGSILGQPATAGSFNLPGFGGTSNYATNPSYAPVYVAGTNAGYDNTNAAVANHPTLFNPSEWQTLPGGSPRAYSLADAKLLSLRYAFAPSFYQAMEVANYAPTSLLGTTYGLPNPYPPAQGTQSAYRLDPAHANRMMLTTYAYSLDRAGLMPMYANQTGGYPAPTATSLALDPTTGVLVNPVTNPVTGQKFPAPGTAGAAGTITDFSSTTQWNNLRATLGAIDLNRALADYRVNPSAPLFSLGNAVNMKTGPAYLQVLLDRQRLARDIFARLVLATGAQATVAMSPTTIGTTNYQAGDVIIAAANPSPEYNALRALAQLAANIVDYIDNDDVSTPFVWNPLDPTDPQNVANFTAAQMPLGVVFGVEKPRLSLSEAYAEVTNDPSDNGLGANQMPQKQAEVRFWLEVQNATSRPHTGSQGPLGDGSAILCYNAFEGGTATPFSPYRIEIVQNPLANPQASSLLRNPSNPTNASNVTGSAGGPQLAFNFTPASGALQRQVLPSGGFPNLPKSTALLIANAAQGNGAPNIAWIPTLVTVPNLATAITGAPKGQTDALSYTTNLPTTDPSPANVQTAQWMNHAILLRRLANPYLPPNDPNVTVPGFAFNAASPINPYITVDFIDNVPTFDAIQKLSQTKTNRSAKSWNAGTSSVQPGYDPYQDVPVGADPIIRRSSVGKVQPYAAMSNPGPTANGAYYPSYTFPNSLVVYQNPVDATGNPILDVRQTLGRLNSRRPVAPAANSSTYNPPVLVMGVPTTDAFLSSGIADTIMTPCDWYVHLDRPLINQLELLHVTGGKSHEAVLNFMVPNTLNQNPVPPNIGRDVVRNTNAAPWLQVFPITTAGSSQYTSATPTSATNALFRAFELLRVQPFGNQTAAGGRLAGRINLNTIMDKRVWDALFDAQVGVNGFTQAQVDALWMQMIQSRTQNLDTTTRRDAAGNLFPYGVPVPGPTIYDTNSATGDRPFLPFGAAQLAAGSNFANGGVAGLDDTILRRPLNPGTTIPVPGAMPMIWNSAAAHPYQQAEAVRKILNNTTTVSHTYAVWVTVGYFEVKAQQPGSTIQGDVVLGSEYYREVPGDTRHRFFAVVDGSNVGLDPASLSTGSVLTAQTRPFFTTLEKTNLTAGATIVNLSAAGQDGSGNIVVYSDGQPVTIQVGSWLAIGTGANRDLVQVAQIGNAASMTPGFTPPNPPGPGVTPTPGYATLTLTAPLLKAHAIGDCVSNIVPGNPGPQLGFDVANTTMYGAVVPHWSRLTQ